MLKKVNEFDRLSKEAVTAESEVLTQPCAERQRKPTDAFYQNSLFGGWDRFTSRAVRIQSRSENLSFGLLRREVWYEYSNIPEELTA